MDPQNTEAQPANAPEGGQTHLPETKQAPVGAWVGALIVITLLIAGALYFWGAQLNAPSDGYTPPLILGDDTESDASAGIPAQSGSDEAAAIEADLEALDFEQFEAQMNADLAAFENE